MSWLKKPSILVGLLILLGIASWRADEARAQGSCDVCYGNCHCGRGLYWTWYPHLRPYYMPRSLGLGGCGGGGYYHSWSCDEEYVQSDANCTGGGYGWAYPPEVAHHFAPLELERLGEVPNDQITDAGIGGQ